MKPTTARLAIGWFALVLLAPWFGWAARGWHATAIDNRTPTALPNLSPIRWLRPATWTQLSKSLDDHLPGRDQAIRARTQLDDRVFGDSSNPQVLKGSDGWLFTADSLNLACYRSREPADLDRVAGRLDEVIPGRVSVLLVPDKLLAVPSLAHGAISSGCDAGARTAIRNARGPDSRILDTWSAFDVAHPQDLWWPQDSHLNGNGEALLVRQIVGQLAAVMTIDPAGQAEMDLPPLLGRRVTATGPTLTVTRTATDPRIEPRTVIIHDSQLTRLTSHLSPFYRDVTFIEYEDLGDFPPRSSLDAIRTAEVVIIETVERQAYQRLTDRLVSFLAS